MVFTILDINVKNNSTMKITQATLQDLKELNDLFDDYRAFYHKKSDKMASKAFLKERIEKDESVIYIARDENGAATGFTQLYPLFSSTRLKRFWLLNDLFVHSDFRGKGISKLLIEQAKQLCVETNACGMYLETSIDNDIGNQLYPTSGFKLDRKNNFYYWDVTV